MNYCKSSIFCVHQFFALCRSKYFAASIFRGFTDVKKNTMKKYATSLKRKCKENAKKKKKAIGNGKNFC